MALSRFHAMPHEGHMKDIKNVYGYLCEHPAIRFRMGIPDHESKHKPFTPDWTYSVYRNIKEELLRNMPEPKGKSV
jgi:hypothetical protein